jgi:ribosomal-protein-alanine N-acetyltransferase
MTPHAHPHPPVIIRPALLADAPAIEQIEHASFIHAGERFGARRIRYLLTTPRAIVSVAEIDGRVVGWVVGLVAGTRREPWGRIYALAVHPEGRGRKIGPRLLDEMIATLRQQKAGRIYLEARTDNSPAIKLYERAGFVFCKALPHYYGPGVQASRMSLDQIP